jgi:hypothetical protein
MIGASYLSIPLVLGYLLLWMMLGVFVLLQAIPGLGEFFGVILSFAPFLLNLGTLILCVLTFAMLFFVTPVIALKGLNHVGLSQMLVKRLKGDPFSNLLLGLMAVLPLILFAGLLMLAAYLTGALCYTCVSPLHHVLQWFFIMIPFACLLSPAVIFFFNFAAEAHAWMQKNLTQQEF